MVELFDEMAQVPAPFPEEDFETWLKGMNERIKSLPVGAKCPVCGRLLKQPQVGPEEQGEGT